MTDFPPNNIPAAPENLPLTELGEFGLIERLRRAMAPTLVPGVLGAGDDCAVITGAPGVAPGASLLITTDTMIEGRHFAWELSSAYDLGWKLLAVNLSDIAACGGTPIAAVLTLQLRPSLESSIIEEIYRGAAALAKNYGVSLVGGDTVRAEEIALGATVIGSCESPVLRSGARPGDDLWVSGTIGLGGLGLAIGRASLCAQKFADRGEAARERYLRPVPRLGLGGTLGNERLATAMLDISDGLFQDAGHIAAASAVRVVVDVTRIPATSVSDQWTIFQACSAGDDYELLFTAAQESSTRLHALSQSTGQPSLTCIGRVEAGPPGIFIETMPGRVQPAAEVLQERGLAGGHDHFGS